MAPQLTMERSAGAPFNLWAHARQAAADPSEAEETETDPWRHRPTLADFFMDREEWISASPVSWLMPGLLLRGGLHILWGDTGIGKTHLALSLASHVAIGSEWHGRTPVQSPVYYCALEGQSGVRQRLRAIEKSLGQPLEGLRLLRDQLDLSSPRFIDPLHLAFRDSPPGLLVIDPLTLAKGNMDVSSGPDVEFVIGALGLLQALGHTVLLIHHSGHNKAREMGSKSLRNLADGSFRLEAKGKTMVLTVVKSRDGETGERLTGRTELIDHEGEGVPVYVPDDSLQGAEPEGSAKLLTEAVEILNCMSGADGGIRSIEWQRAWEAATGLKATAFYRYRDKAARTGKVHQEGTGRDARYFPVVTKSGPS